MGKVKETIKKSMVDVIFKEKKQGDKFGYYYNLLGLALFPVWLVMLFWTLLEWLIEGQVKNSLIDNLVAFSFSIASFIVLIIGMFIGKELHIREKENI